jgi:protein disulfide-isomerase
MASHMIRSVRALSLAALIISAVSCAQPQDKDTVAVDTSTDGPAWIENFDEAKAEAKKTGRPILADFTGSDWCVWCKKLKSEVYDTATFKAWAKDHVVLLVVDFPDQKPQTPALAAQNEKLAKTYGVDSYPSVLIMDSAGTKLGQMGYEPGGPDSWIADFKKVTDGAK